MSKLFLLGKSCKKSFSLIELVIVVAIIGVIATMAALRGKETYDKAKVVAISHEISGYQQKFVAFKSIYSAYPGNLDYETCSKYGEFSQLNSDKDGIEIGDYCQSDRQSHNLGKTDEGFAGDSIAATNISWSSFLNGMRFMQTAEMIKTVETTIADTELENGYYTGLNDASTKGPWNVTCEKCITYNNVKRTQAKTSFDERGAITIGGIILDKANPQSYNLNFIRGSNNSANIANGHEFYDENVARLVNMRNIIFVYKNTSSTLDSTFGCGSSATGVLSATMTRMLDEVMDNGKPGSGKFIALKNGYTQSLSDDKEKKKVCYNTLQNEISKAQYVSDTQGRTGCNFMYIMEEAL